jgi:hypoxanthine phosphoribosyltransferase
VRLVKDLSLALQDRDVILVEDIVDTGLTMQYLMHYLEAACPAATGRRPPHPSPPGAGRGAGRLHRLHHPDAYVYGYGLDRDQLDRNLPFITSVAAE